MLTVNQLLATDLAERYRLPLPASCATCRSTWRASRYRHLSSAPLGRRTRCTCSIGAHVGLSQHGVDFRSAACAAGLRIQPGPGQLEVGLTLRGDLLAHEERACAHGSSRWAAGGRAYRAAGARAEALVSAAVADGAEVGLAVHPPLCLSYVYTTKAGL